jgi:hypothetical protein
LSRFFALIVPIGLKSISSRSKAATVKDFHLVNVFNGRHSGGFRRQAPSDGSGFSTSFSLNNPIKSDGRVLTSCGHFRSSGGPDVTLLASAKEN